MTFDNARHDIDIGNEGEPYSGWQKEIYPVHKLRDCASKYFDVLCASFVSKMKCTLDGFFVDMFAQAYPLGETWGGNENDKNNKDHNIFPPKRTSSIEQFINL